MLNKESFIKIFTIAKFTFKEVVKSKILLNTAFLGLGLLIVSYIAYSFTYGEPSRVALDFGLGTLSLSSVGIAIFIGVGLLSKEIESRTVYMIVSRPVPRFAFIVGKVLGLSGVLVINILILSSLTLLTYFSIGGEYNNLIFWCIWNTILESVLVLLLVGCFSLVTSQTLSVLYTITLYILGHAVAGALETQFVLKRQVLYSFLELYHFIFPAFYKLNVKDFVLYKNDLDLSYLLQTSSYAGIYSLFLVFLAILIFEKKNLD